MCQLDSGQWPKTAKKVPLAGVDDKCQIIAIFGATTKGGFLPPQLIHQGKTENCIPRT